MVLRWPVSLTGATANEPTGPVSTATVGEYAAALATSRPMRPVRSAGGLGSRRAFVMMMTVGAADGASCRGDLEDPFAGELLVGEWVPDPVGDGLGAPAEAPGPK